MVGQQRPRLYAGTGRTCSGWRICPAPRAHVALRRRARQWKKASDHRGLRHGTGGNFHQGRNLWKVAEAKV
jgi:hypothetical protein